MTNAQEEQVVRFNPYVNNRVETHLEFTVYYQSVDGRNRWSNGVLAWDSYQHAEALMQKVLSYQTAFVQQQWLRIEVCVPNRDNYGNLRADFIKDPGMLLATRQARRQP